MRVKPERLQRQAAAARGRMLLCNRQAARLRQGLGHAAQPLVCLEEGSQGAKVTAASPAAAASGLEPHLGRAKAASCESGKQVLEAGMPH